MREGIIVKVPTGSAPASILKQWLFLRFVFDEADPEEPTYDSISGALVPKNGPEFVVSEAEAFRIMDAQRPGMADFFRQHQVPEVAGGDFVFFEDEIHFLEGTQHAWG